jgi:hypothetical protein
MAARTWCRHDHRVLLTVVSRSTTIVAVFVAGAVAWSLVPGAPALRAPFVAGASAVAACLYAIAVASLVRRGNRSARDIRLLLAAAPRWRLILAGFLIACFVAAAIVTVSLMDLRGAPTIHDGHYTLDDHGTFTVISKSTYDEQTRAGLRIALIVVGALNAVGGVLTAGARRRRDGGAADASLLRGTMAEFRNDRW